MTSFATTSRDDTAAYDLRGPGGAPSVVFVAGAGPFRATDPITTTTAELLASRGITTVVWDRLGRGESTAEGRLDLDRELAAVASMIEVAGGSTVLCGHSSGCAIALRAQAAGLPVDGLVLWEAPLSKPGAEVADWVAEVERLIDAGRLEAAQEHYVIDMPPEWLAAAKASPAWPQIFAGVVTLRADGQALVAAQRALEEPGGMSGIGVPLLAVVGTETFPGMTRAADALAAAAPDGSSLTVPGAQHTWEPPAMAETMAAFVERCAGRGTS